MASKKKSAKKRGPDQVPSINELILRKALKYYETYCVSSNTQCSLDIVKLIQECIETDTPITKIIVQPYGKNESTIVILDFLPPFYQYKHESFQFVLISIRFTWSH